MRIIIGTFLLLLGLIFRWLAMRELGKDFKLTLEAPSKIVTKGVYKYVRHPSYAGSILIIAGLSLLCLPLAVTYLAFAFFLARATNEEKILGTNEHYQEYKKRTGMFLPKIF